ncbi:helix-turn-helix domain-containing protein [Listeria portnoyi]|uniref:helix-turn-helix domain-containing protein n=1 Tax=Listeria portnoyi TaxID=2713504 RepID=UPI0031B60727
MKKTKKSISTLDMYYEEHIDSFVDLKTYLSEVEIHCIKKIIERNDGNMTQTAIQLGIHRSILYRKLNGFEKKK